MTFMEIFTELKDKFMQADVKDVPGHLAMQVNLRGEGEGAFYAELNDGVLTVEPYEYYDRDVIFEVDSALFRKIVDGKADPVKSYLTGKLKITGDLDKALTIQKLIRK